MNENWYERNVLPYVIDLGCGMKEIRAQREKIVPCAHGRVLEVGIGTGLNIPYYDPARVGKIVGVEPSLRMHRLARRRIARSGLEVELVGLSAERIPLDDASFDSVVVTYTLCTIPDPVAALREMRRLLKPQGLLYFCEHGRAPDADVQRWQDRLNPWWGKLFGGCNLNRDVPALLQTAGFACDDLQARYIKGPRLATYNYWGVARPDPSH